MKPNCKVFNGVWRKSCKVVKVKRYDVDHMIKTHYLKRWPGVCVLILGLEYNNHRVGVAVFALPPRETNKRYNGKTWELARLWINDSIPQNGETWFISKCIKYIKINYSDVKFLVSYADPSANHFGLIYRAANWISDGKTDEGRKTPRCDYVDINTGKHYSRRSHIKDFSTVKRVYRVSKYRFYYIM